IYCYSEEERQKAVDKLQSASLEITRFKGLGEISPHEFKPFIGPEMRLNPVKVGAFSDIKPTLEFYMGKNTPDRKEFIMKHLIVEESTPNG
ncbi:MAG: type IIA DNA topoisomerase subunit B, partial [Chlamydiota bacterium]